LVCCCGTAAAAALLASSGILAPAHQHRDAAAHDVEPRALLLEKDRPLPSPRTPMAPLPPPRFLNSRLHVFSSAAKSSMEGVSFVLADEEDDRC
jgi:hypothetical protein